MPRTVRLNKRLAATLATLADGQPHPLTKDNKKAIHALRRLKLVSVPRPAPVVPGHLPRGKQAVGGQAAVPVQAAPEATITPAGTAHLQANPAPAPAPEPPAVEPPVVAPADPAAPAPAPNAQPQG